MKKQILTAIAAAFFVQSVAASCCNRSEEISLDSIKTCVAAQLEEGKAIADVVAALKAEVAALVADEKIAADVAQEIEAYLNSLVVEVA
jgi:hypothetical protein